MPDILQQTALIDSLTPKQREVIALVADGMTSKEIARKLDISESAVNQRIEGIRQRLGGMSRGKIARIYRHTSTFVVTIPTSNPVTGKAIQLQPGQAKGHGPVPEGAGNFGATTSQAAGVLQPSTLPPWLCTGSIALRRLAAIVGLAIGILAVAILVIAVGHALAILARDLG